MFIPKGTTKQPDLSNPLLTSCDFLYWASNDYWSLIPRQAGTLTNLPSAGVGPVTSSEGFAHYTDHTSNTNTRMAFTVDKGWTAKQSGMCWFKLNAIQNSGFPRVFSFDGRGVNTYFMFYVRHSNHQTVLQHFAGSTTTNFVATTNAASGVPQCLAYTVDATAGNWSVKLYLNGVDVSPATTAVSAIVEATQSRATITNSPAGGAPIQGFLYGQSHWQRVLSADEIRAAYLEIPKMFK